MKVIEYFTTENKEHWLGEIGKCDWGAGQFLYQLLSENKLKSTVGATALVPMLVDGDALVSFCTLAPLDDIQPTDLTSAARILRRAASRSGACTITLAIMESYSEGIL